MGICLCGGKRALIHTWSRWPGITSVSTLPHFSIYCCYLKLIWQKSRSLPPHRLTPQTFVTQASSLTFCTFKLTQRWKSASCNVCEVVSSCCFWYTMKMSLVDQMLLTTMFNILFTDFKLYRHCPPDICNLINLINKFCVISWAEYEEFYQTR